MNLAIEFHEEARDEYREAARWYENESEGLGEEFTNAVDSALERLARGEVPGLAITSGEPTTVQRLLLRRFRYAVYFEVQGDRLFVWAVANQRRRPGYWKNRT